MSDRMTTEPEGLTRQEYVDWFAAIGLDANEMASVDCGMREITVTAYALNERGSRYLVAPDDVECTELATYTIVIPVAP
jgi:hypothetical protein